jgi:phage terminase large subunit GpA-like protein
MTLIKGFLDGLRPEPLLTVSQWADLHRMLSTEASAEAGRWRTDRTPYLREIMDKLSAIDPTEEVIVMKGVQLGLTEMGFNLVGYVMDNAPGPIMYVLPTKELAERNSKTRLAPMIESTPRLREKVAPQKSRTSANTVLMKDFPGGVLVMAGANSAATLRNMPVRFLVLDEVDGFPLDVGGEGSPVDLAIKRTSTFSRKKIFKLSTPTIEGSSVIAMDFETTDQRFYHVPCPECGAMQKLIFAQLRWERGKPSTAKYECIHCGEKIAERFKTKMLASGKWVADHPDRSSHRKVGYHINSLYSPFGWYSWEQAAEEWELSKGNEPKRKTFINTVLGETYKIKGDAPAWENLYNRREQYTPNTLDEKICFLTAGVDVQGDRIELEIVGWCIGRESYSVDYRVITGDTTKPEAWAKLAKVANEQFPHPLGGNMGISLMAVDSGYNTSYVYDFCKQFGDSRVIPIKGKDTLANVMVSPPRAIRSGKDGKAIKGISVWHVNTGMIKSEVYGFLRLEIGEEGAPDGYCHFPQYDRHYFRMLTAEQLRKKKNTAGFDVYEWVKVFDRNEALDCRVYARAAAAVMNMDLFTEENWQAMRGRSLGIAPREKPKKRKAGGFWEN